jgi:hypothetical protein
MPWIGGMDVSLGLLMACVPLPVVLLHLTVWGLWTSALRPLSGDSVWELVERAGNYGVPLAFLLLVGVPRRLRGWFTPAWPSVMRPLTADTARVIHWMLRVTTCLLLLGHGALGALNSKPTLTGPSARRAWVSPGHRGARRGTYTGWPTPGPPPDRTTSAPG